MVDLTEVTTILVPLDGSAFSQHAIPTAVGLAERLDADIVLLSAVPTEDDAPAREAELDATPVPWPRVERMVVMDKDVAGAIHQALRDRPGSVACMASHGRGRTAALVGSVATEVIVRGHDPLVLVGPMVDEPPRGSGVLACVDETPQSVVVAEVGLAWAELLLDEPLTVIVVAEPVPPPTRGPARRLFGPDGDPEVYLDSVIAQLPASGPASAGKVKAEVVYDPIGPADGVVSYVEEHPTDLVVVRSHARTGVRRLTMGSVAAAIVHSNPAPVLVIPASD
jgi:nucleotide-binding universal stress UspA family protein